MDFSLSTAQKASQTHQLEQWVHRYLNTGEWKNSSLSDGLKLQTRWWFGPVRVSLDVLKRSCGPEPHMEYVQDPNNWSNRVTTIADSLTAIEHLPPLIVQYRDGSYSIRDGNHRYEAIVRKGWTSCWVIIWYDSLADKNYDSSTNNFLESN